MITVISPAKKLSDKCNAVDVGFSAISFKPFGSTCIPT